MPCNTVAGSKGGSQKRERESETVKERENLYPFYDLASEVTCCHTHPTLLVRAVTAPEQIQENPWPLVGEVSNALALQEEHVS